MCLCLFTIAPTPNQRKKPSLVWFLLLSIAYFIIAIQAATFTFRSTRRLGFFECNEHRGTYAKKYDVIPRHSYVCAWVRASHSCLCVSVCAVKPKTSNFEKFSCHCVVMLLKCCSKGYQTVARSWHAHHRESCECFASRMCALSVRVCERAYETLDSTYFFFHSLLLRFQRFQRLTANLPERRDQSSVVDVTIHMSRRIRSNSVLIQLTIFNWSSSSLVTIISDCVIRNRRIKNDCENYRRFVGECVCVFGRSMIDDLKADDDLYFDCIKCGILTEIFDFGIFKQNSRTKLC